jgi:diaminopimelate epimerase
LKRISFSKYHGAGNDFILINFGDGIVQELSESDIRFMCNRHFGIGADGLMLLLPSEKADFRMKYYNSDGLEGTMCGNGGRCITAFARSCGIVKTDYIFEAIDGIHTANFVDNTNVSLKMQDVDKVEVLEDGYFLNTGSPHFVFLNDNPHIANINELGNKYRYDNRFGSGGTNVNAIRINNDTIDIATFERGVEAETLSCGTGSVAAAIVAGLISANNNNDFKINAKGGNLRVSFGYNENGGFNNVYLKGPAEFIFKGDIVILS